MSFEKNPLVLREFLIISILVSKPLVRCRFSIQCFFFYFESLGDASTILVVTRKKLTSAPVLLDRTAAICWRLYKQVVNRLFDNKDYFTNQYNHNTYE